MNDFKTALFKTKNAFINSILVLLGVILLISIIITIIPDNLKIETGVIFLDTLIAAIFGSIAAGNPITSYIIGGELLAGGISLLAVTAFIVAWVTVGVIQFPAESYLLGKKFALTRNIVGFISSIIIAFLVIITMGFF